MLAKRMNDIGGSPTSALIAKVAELRGAGENIISLNVGEPDFGTPAVAKIAGIKAICDNFTKYTPSPGILELRREISKKLERDNKVIYGMEEICATVGAKQAIYNSLMALVDEGDEVLIPIPCWVSYTDMVRLAGGTPVFVSVCEDYALDLDAIEAAITRNTKAIIICTPNNPSGAVYSRDSLERLADLACKHDFYVIADEIYEKLIYDKDCEHVSIASLGDSIRDRTVTVNGMSKAFAMTGWRIGYAASTRTIIKAMKAIQSQTTSATNAIAQKAAIDALRYGDQDVHLMVCEFKRRRDYVVKRIEELEGFTCRLPQGAFYALVDVSNVIGKQTANKTIQNSFDLASYLLDEAKVALVPGESFNIKEKVRISYSNSIENIDKAFNRIEIAISKLR
ncbi:aminotransferase class I and II [Coriobacterium glomerans PW2]|uniref:Aminotransferase n=1 Tax=Coriobacterium glomerans (strain ATCC 49209 / DSM 20642 / JCM 10262 / PW2) TaxID=700015 RepID=F2NBC4_CORGP|nr:pyridoxal phosphate-dependent aminotransferase [Coriobacterium glomerans]AEB06660.1 aminotransferase class I and II [Coriobacterium glomerans PW2]